MSAVFKNASFSKKNDLDLKFFLKKRTPLILQMEASECGLACIAMIAAYYGSTMEMLNFREKFEVSARGTNLQQIATICDEIGLNARCIELDSTELINLKLPAILHWDGNHWLVATKINSKGLELNDPAQGNRWVGWIEAKSKFSGYAVEITPRARLERTPPQPKLQLLTLYKSFPGLGKAVLQLMSMSIVLEAIALLMPYYSQIVMDHVLINNDFELLKILTIGTVFLLIFQILFTALRGWAGVVLSQNISFQLYAHVIRHLFRLPVNFFIRRQVGDLVSRFDSLGQMAHSLTRTSIDITLDALISLGTVAMMFLYSSTLAWITMTAFFSTLIIKIFVFSSSRRIVAEKTFIDARKQSHLIESIRGIHAVKMGQGEIIRSQQWTTYCKKVFEKEAASEKINLFSALTVNLAIGISHISVIYFASQMILANQLSVGMLFAFMAYQSNFTGRASAFADRILWLRTMNVHFGRVSDIVFATPEVQPTYSSDNSIDTAHAVIVKNLSYRYSNTDPYVFEKISFEVTPNELVVLVGPSGCGKTTLLCVLGGIFLPATGTLFYNGEAVNSINATSLRKRVAFVFQSDELFEGSIEDNISFFDQQPDKQRIRECAELACIDADITLLPQGYRTRLAEQGAGLSGGQRQRMLIARALYRQPSLLVLDEATSHLDVTTEKQILQNLKKLKITIIMSAHRPDAIALADRIYSVQTKSWMNTARL